MLKNCTIGQETIARHNTDGAIFDDYNLALLREYCADPSKKDDFLKRHGLVDEEGQTPGVVAERKSSLIGYAITTGAFPDEQATLLRDWFESGAAGV